MTLTQFRSWINKRYQDVVGGWPAQSTEEEQAPLRAELFSADQMEQHGKWLASAHSLGRASQRDQLLQRLDDNKDVLINSCKLLSEAVKNRSRIAPAGEWLLDNFYLIEEQIRTARQHLPKGYSRELPRLARGPSAGLPRVYDLALEAIAHGDGRLDAETLGRFIAAYQTQLPLTLGELWAIPIMLRLALIENLRRVAVRVTDARVDVNTAQDWAVAMIDIAESDPKSLILVISDMARSNPPMTSAFVAELARRLQGHGPALALPLNWIEHRLGEASLTIEQLVLAETQQQAADQVSISNSIGSLRFLGAMDWRLFVESMSLVERVLQEDIDGVYGAMDFATRDSYRRIIDRLAKHSDYSEIQVARAAIELARQAAKTTTAPDQTIRRHVGYYLVDKGLPQLRHTVRARIPLVARWRASLSQKTLWLQLTASLLITLGITYGLMDQLSVVDISGWRWGVVALITFIAASHLATTLVNWFATQWVTPTLLPRLDFAKGLPSNMRSMTVIPCLLTHQQGIDELLEALEVRFLGNRDEYIHFGLLTDFTDASAQTLPGDDALVAHARAGIERLNARYPAEQRTLPEGDLAQPQTDRFFLFHRARRWNPAEQVWMGYERKRGKLADLNALLRGSGEDAFALVVGNTAALTSVKYVITLDTDTQMPRDAAREFIATMAHPLNQPRFDATFSRVVDGYGILQPRMAASLSAASRSRYARLYGGEAGIDPYTRSVSDVYQDLYGEGSFIGKGIYEVDAFEQALRGRLPENRILSHDLLEGCYARSGLLSDVHLYEDYPARYAADVSRRERWIRGDWQIAQWLLPRVPGANGQRLKNPLSLLSRWKVYDNLQRSLVPGALLLLLLVGWSVLPKSLIWTLCVLGIVLLPVVLLTLVDTWRRPEEVALRPHLVAVGQSAYRHLAQGLFRISCLPQEAVFSLAAIATALGRMARGKRLLVWHASSGVERAAEPCSVSLMWSAPVVGAFGLGAVAALNPSGLWTAAPVLTLWLCAPLLVWWVSKPLESQELKLDAEQNLFLAKISRKTWAFFEQFVGAQDHWLPPDNYQEQPGPIIAHRTSPTNMGLALLANLAAWDFGYIGSNRLLTRTRDTLDTMSSLPKHLGHFYNWYDTLSLQPLPPRYVSAVDSGNLAGHLFTLRAGLLSLPEQAVMSPRLFTGLRDTLALVADATPAAQQQVVLPLQALLTTLETEHPADLAALLSALDNLDVSNVMAPSHGASLPELDYWVAGLARQHADARADLLALAPWLQLPPAPADCLPEHAQLPASLNAELGIPSLQSLAAICPVWLQRVDSALLAATSAAQVQWLSLLQTALQQGLEESNRRLVACHSLARQSCELAQMDFEFLYDRSRHLLAIGYNVDDFRRDTSFYDLLASEARLGSFVAVAQGQLPQESWFALGRLRTAAEGDPILVSWSGSMFEYLMPMLVMPSYPGTLLDQTCRAAVARQIAYGKLHSLPWGVSESGYNTVDANLNYQYHAFGVPGLGLKRGLAEDMVIAPYASAMALMVAPDAACTNLQRLTSLGLEGRYGMYEAVDYTASRLGRGQTSVIVQSFMVHHQGMSLLALASVLLGQPMQRRFCADPQFQATLLLLQERIPKSAIFRTQAAETAQGGALFDSGEGSVYTPIAADTPVPEVQLLSNGRYHVMVTNAGGGYSRWKDLAVTRWREDSTRDHWGNFIYLKDVESGAFWSAAHQPTLARADSYAAMFSEGRAEFRRRDSNIETYTEIVVSPEDDIEMRRVRLTNRSRFRRTIEITSYAEVVLALPAGDAVQTAFGNLFVQTEILPGSHALLCSRRPRSQSEATPTMFHLLTAHGSELGQVSYETDRMAFTGRGNTLVAPRALTEDGPLAGGCGSVLDPIIAIRCRITLEAEQSVTVDFVTGAADTRAASMALIDKYQDWHLADRVFDLAATHSGVTLRQINATEADALTYRRLARSVLYANSALRAEPNLLMQNRRGQSGLWGYAISGDLPIVLLTISNSEHIELARQLIQCHAYWRLKGLMVDLVIWNEDHVGYRQRLQDQIVGLIATGIEAHSIDRPGGIFVRSAEQISHEDRILLQSVARAIIADSRGSLAEQINRRVLMDKRVTRLVPTRRPSVRASTSAETKPAANLLLANNLGGFSADGREYVITTSATSVTPLPWVNVLANPQFGTVITESGLAYTWSENAHEFRLTPWSDDPVGTAGGEAIYLRDEETGQFWSPSPLPCRGTGHYTTRHGFGYSIFEHVEDGVSSELCVYVDLAESVKFSVLKIRNLSGRTRKLSATGYVEWVLGDIRTKSAMHLVTELDPASGALFARNAYNAEFGGRVGFFDVDDLARTLSGDRAEFLGRNGSMSNPNAMTRSRLSGRMGAGLDPCGAIQVPFELGQGQEREIIFRLGAGQDLTQARALALRLRTQGSARSALDRVHIYWRSTLGAVQVETPDPALNVLANGWLLYQTLACRIWARSGFYQSGGAFGFRDQLQDSMALVHSQPQLLRNHLRLCASRQYAEGDVQHWWHPPAGRGVRTRCSDDYLWLPLAACRYVNSTGDYGVLSENLPFLEGRQLNADEESYYDLPGQSLVSASVYQHCVRAIEHGLRLGEHGLPLMGSGDWNDGMNLVGIHGRGESVWLGFFLYEVLMQFSEVARQQQDLAFVTRCQTQAAALRENLEQHAWDGAWYKRAWFDDGSALGTATNSECAIDSIAQSWSVLSGAGSPEHCRQAMESLDKYLVRRDRGLVQLLDPPFDTSDLNPGYIKGYVPGVRENGGQYTHAAVWATMAFAAQGDKVRAWELYQLINPLSHTQTAEDVAVFKAEPYVMTADVYGVAPHIGRGGWSWYTGSAGLMYRLILESLLGITRQGNRLILKPCIPRDWTEYSFTYTFGQSTYTVLVTQTIAPVALGGDSIAVSLDGVLQADAGFVLKDDLADHRVEVKLLTQ